LESSIAYESYPRVCEIFAASRQLHLDNRAMAQGTREGEVVLLRCSEDFTRHAANSSQSRMIGEVCEK